MSKLFPTEKLYYTYIKPDGSQYKAWFRVNIKPDLIQTD